VTWELLQEVFTVDTLMTPRRDLLVWERGTDRSAVCAEAAERHFDIVPIVEGDRIVGVLPLETMAPEPLTDRWLVSRDTGIPDLITLFAATGRPALLVFSLQDVIGLVAPADLNQLPARTCLYNLIGELEMNLALLIRQCYVDHPEQALLALSEGRQRAVQERRCKQAEGDTDVDPVQLLDLSDLIDIVAKQEVLRSRLGFPSRNSAEDSLNTLVDLRHRVMHPVRSILRSLPQDLQKLAERIERVHDLLEKAKAQSRGDGSA